MEKEMHVFTYLVILPKGDMNKINVNLTQQ